jgi:BMFP domain-containing protein YqiC
MALWKPLRGGRSPDSDSDLETVRKAMKRMGPDNKVLDDIARVAGGAVNILSGMRQQMRDDVRARVEEVAARLDLVPRDDFEQARAMIARLGRQVDALESRLDALEGKGRKSAKAKPGKKKRR